MHKTVDIKLNEHNNFQSDSEEVVTNKPQKGVPDHQMK